VALIAVIADFQEVAALGVFQRRVKSVGFYHGGDEIYTLDRIVLLLTKLRAGTNKIGYQDYTRETTSRYGS
jgi:hypothetical protein